MSDRITKRTFQVIGNVDQFSVFRDAIWIRGWVASETDVAIHELAIRFPNGRSMIFKPKWESSPDVAASLGNNQSRCRFDEFLRIGELAAFACNSKLEALDRSGRSAPVTNLGNAVPSEVNSLFDRFLSEIQRSTHDAKILELGSRSRSGVVRRSSVSDHADYVGCDILDGENVDVVCDAHELSKAFARSNFDWFMSFSVFEHLLMPWKVALEMNAILKDGAIGFIQTHQAWPMHDEPWDFWRFSDRSWKGLFNSATGFEIIATAMGEPANLVAQQCHPVTNFAPDAIAYLASAVLFRKVSGTALSWPVDLQNLAIDHYPV